MARINRKRLTGLRGSTRLVVEAATGTTDVVEAVHRTIQDAPLPVGRYESTRTRGVTGLVYRAVRGGMRLVGHGLDLGLARLEPLLPEGDVGETEEALLAVVNGVYGDHLAASQNPLAIELELRAAGGAPVVEAPARGRLVVLAHGLCMGDLQWRRRGHDHGAALAEAFGLAPVYLRYNSGLSVPTNGRVFARALEELVAAWPVEVTELSLVGFSMGGLVARSAIVHGQRSEMAWTRHLERLVCLGTPHLGAPLAQGGHWLNEAAEWVPYTAPLGRMARRRSAGLHDLRHGTVVEPPESPLALPEGVACFAVAASRSAAGKGGSRLAGDGLVPVASALGGADDQARALAFPREHRLVVHGAGHLDLLHREEVIAQLLEWWAA